VKAPEIKALETEANEVKAPESTTTEAEGRSGKEG